MRNIHSHAFDDTEIMRIDSNTSNPPQTGSVFTREDAERIELHVPRGSLEKYRSAPVWKYFTNIIADLD